MRLNFGDLDLVVEARIPGLHPPRVLWRLGPVRPLPRPLSPSRPVGLPTNPNPRGVQLMASIMDDQQISFAISGVDDRDNPASLGSTPPVFSVDRPDVLALTVGADGFSGVVAAVGPLGTGVLSVTGQTDSGVTYQGSAAVDVTPSGVVAVSFSFGTPEPVAPAV